MVAGFPNPTKDLPLLRYVLRAIRRRQGDAAPKQPVTPQMLRQVHRNLDFSARRSTAVWAALLTGFGLLLRASEYLAHEADGAFDDDKVIRWEDITFRQDGKVVTPGQEGASPNEVIVRFRSSKVDQFKAGCLRNVFSTGLPDLCPVAAMWRWAVLSGGKTGPAMSVPGEAPVSREEVTELLKEAAVALGDDEDDLGTHSLRIGGATALYAAGYPPPEISYQGRWASECWMTYVHRTAARSVDVSRDMFTQRVSLLRRQAVASTKRLGEDENQVPRQPLGKGGAEGKVAGPGKPNKGGRRAPAPINRAQPIADERVVDHDEGRALQPSGSRGSEDKGVAGTRRPLAGGHVCSLQSLFGCGDSP